MVHNPAIFKRFVNEIPNFSQQNVRACLHIDLSIRYLSIPLNISVLFSVQFSVDVMCVQGRGAHMYLSKYTLV